MRLLLLTLTFSLHASEVLFDPCYRDSPRHGCSQTALQEYVELPSGHGPSMIRFFCDVSESVGPPDNGQLQVIGGELFRKKVYEALELLKQKSPKHYRFVLEHLGTINESDRSGVMYWIDRPVFNLKLTPSIKDAYWIASVIYHDSFHVHQHRKNLPVVGAEGEKHANREQLQMLRELEAPAATIAHMEKFIDVDHSDLNGDGKFDAEDVKLRDY